MFRRTGQASRLSRRAIAALAAGFVVAAGAAHAQVSEETVKSLGAPDKIDTSMGTLEFWDGVPSSATAARVYDTLDFVRALEAYNNSFRGASALAIVKGFEG
ncbi:MAG TPA: hypothetical protein VFK86_21725, partial [Bauldia sp.]|nr:hypothetical protein [Bauldia sp.]